MIRRATYSDIPALYALFEAMHGSSIYAGVSALDEKRTKALLVQSVQRHGGENEGSTLLMVVDDERGEPVGFILGVLTKLYDVCADLTASDSFFYVAPGAPARAAGKLLDAVIAWAEAAAKVSVLRFAVTDAIGDVRRTGRLYQRRGFRVSGAIYEREVRR